MMFEVKLCIFCMASTEMFFTVLVRHEAPLGRRRAELGGGRHLIYGAVEDDIRLAAFGLCCGHG